MDTLLTLAEVAAAMAGFSSIVVMFKRQATETWCKADADRFHGMILHSISAVLFALLPFVFLPFDVPDYDTFRWCSGLLGIVTGVHVAIISRLESSSSIGIRLQIIAGGGTIVVLQVLGGIGMFPDYGLGIYLVGVFWHLLQAGLLFVTLIWIPTSQVDGD